MSDYVRRAFRAQLNSTLDSLLRTAVVEISRIFESSLCDHQVELAQQAEEISGLQHKLEKAEQKLRKGGGGDREKKENCKDNAKREPAIATTTADRTSGSSCSSVVVVAPEIDAEVPDDWCAPLGCEDVAPQPHKKMQEEAACPSVSLRPLSVSLWRIPAIKQEVEDDDFEPHLLTSLEHSPRITREKTQAVGSIPSPMIYSIDAHKRPSPEERLQDRLKRIEDMSLPLPPPPPVRRGPGRPRGSKSAKNRLQAIVKQEEPEVPVEEEPEVPVATGRGQRVKAQPQTQAVNCVKTGKKCESPGKKKKISVTESVSEQVEEKVTTPTKRQKKIKTYTCKFCRKDFETQFGRSVHVRSHKKCPGCQRIFPYPSSLRVHMQTCRKVKAMNATNKLVPVAAPPEAEPIATPAKDEQIPAKKSTPTSQCDSSVSPATDVSTSSKREKRYSCPECHKMFGYLFTLRDHMRLHTGEKPFACAKCPQKFRVKYLLKMHALRVHREQKEPREPRYVEANGDWTVPVEEDEQVEPGSPGGEDLLLARSPKRNRVPWEEMGRQVPDGFSCLLCERVLTSKYSLVQHFRIHTGEKPVVCERCGEKFRCHPLMSLHRKKCCGPWIKCQKCGKMFTSQKKCTKHMVEVHKDRSYECQLCGKGFTSARRLSNHYERAHV